MALITMSSRIITGDIPFQHTLQHMALGLDSLHSFFLPICTFSTSLSPLLLHHCHLLAALPPLLTSHYQSCYFLYCLLPPKCAPPTSLGCIPSLFATIFICLLVPPYPKQCRMLWQIIFHPLPYLSPHSLQLPFLLCHNN